jgi:hypothetical protein
VKMLRRGFDILRSFPLKNILPQKITVTSNRPPDGFFDLLLWAHLAGHNYFHFGVGLGWVGLVAASIIELKVTGV